MKHVCKYFFNSEILGTLFFIKKKERNWILVSLSVRNLSSNSILHETRPKKRKNILSCERLLDGYYFDWIVLVFCFMLQHTHFSLSLSPQNIDTEILTVTHHSINRQTTKQSLRVFFPIWEKTSFWNTRLHSQKRGREIAIRLIREHTTIGRIVAEKKRKFCKESNTRKKKEKNAGEEKNLCKPKTKNGAKGKRCMRGRKESFRREYSSVSLRAVKALGIITVSLSLSPSLSLSHFLKASVLDGFDRVVVIRFASVPQRRFAKPRKIH